ncbi:MAG: branched-chain amino acid transport system permease protein [Gaiellaceae bacterium]|nr:branched-chain amino acid transport system permease protein [Gaiellaceae bacterium]MDX6513199.1 branched-chain amino acid transport system permease protein [Gaiellaceae bacterium]
MSSLLLAFDWNRFVQLTVDGLTRGSVYALIALGYTMVYGVLKLLNFAHGDIYMVGSFVGYGVLTKVFGGAANPGINVAVLIALMMIAAMLGAGLLGVAIERVAYRPLRNAPRIAPLISALGVAFFLENAALIIVGGEFRSYDPFTLVSPLKGIHHGVVNIWILQIVVFVTAVVLMISLTLLVNRTRLGKAMRATSFDREAAAMMGIDIDKVIVATFFIGSALAGAAGVMQGLVFGTINNYMGFVAGLKGFTAAVIGGIGYIPGAMFGGMALGLIEAYVAGSRIGNTFVDLVTLSILIVVMLVRPTGIFGKATIEKV